MQIAKKEAHIILCAVPPALNDNKKVAPVRVSRQGLTRVCPKHGQIILLSFRKGSADMTTNEIQKPVEPLTKPHSQEVLETAAMADSQLWAATSQDQRRQALAQMREIFQQNTKPGDTAFELSTDANRITMDHGTSENLSRINASRNDIDDLALRTDKDGNFIATYTHEDHETHAKTTYQVTQDTGGNITFKVDGKETNVDGQVVSADGTTTHDVNDSTVTVRNQNGTIAFHGQPDGTYVGDVTFADGTKTQKPISAAAFQFQQNNGALFIDFEKDHHFSEGAVPQPLAPE
jgi:hypothetical protein